MIYALLQQNLLQSLLVLFAVIVFITVFMFVRSFYRPNPDKYSIIENQNQSTKTEERNASTKAQHGLVSNSIAEGSSKKLLFVTRNRPRHQLGDPITSHQRVKPTDLLSDFHEHAFELQDYLFNAEEEDIANLHEVMRSEKLLQHSFEDFPVSDDNNEGARRLYTNPLTPYITQNGLKRKTDQLVLQSLSGEDPISFESRSMDVKESNSHHKRKASVPVPRRDSKRLNSFSSSSSAAAALALFPSFSRSRSTETVDESEFTNIFYPTPDPSSPKASKKIRRRSWRNSFLASIDEETPPSPSASFRLGRTKTSPTHRYQPPQQHKSMKDLSFDEEMNDYRPRTQYLQPEEPPKTVEDDDDEEGEEEDYKLPPINDVEGSDNKMFASSSPQRRQSGMMRLMSSFFLSPTTEDYTMNTTQEAGRKTRPSPQRRKSMMQHLQSFVQAITLLSPIAQEKEEAEVETNVSSPAKASGNNYPPIELFSSPNRETALPESPSFSPSRMTAIASHIPLPSPIQTTTTTTTTIANNATTTTRTSSGLMPVSEGKVSKRSSPLYRHRRVSVQYRARNFSSVSSVSSQSREDEEDGKEKEEKEDTKEKEMMKKKGRKVAVMEAVDDCFSSSSSHSDSNLSFESVSDREDPTEGERTRKTGGSRRTYRVIGSQKQSQHQVTAAATFQRPKTRDYDVSPANPNHRKTGTLFVAAVQKPSYSLSEDQRGLDTNHNSNREGQEKVASTSTISFVEWMDAEEDPHKNGGMETRSWEESHSSQSSREYQGL